MTDKAEVMLVTVGGSLEPLIKSIQHYQPDTVYFIVSQQTVEHIAAIKAGAAGCNFKHHTILLDDINEVTGCYETILRCTAGLEKANLPREAVIADFTGGTKAISSALVLAAVTRGYPLSYTGGSNRSEGGTGKVESGAETFVQQVNPWEALAVEERKLAAEFFNHSRFEEACEVLSRAANKVDAPKIRRLLESLEHLSEAYAEWDKFHHREALNRLQKAFSEIQAYADIAGDSQIAGLSEQVSHNLEFLRELSSASGQFKKVCRPYVLDLLANARRRAAEGKYDDAVARLYCSLGLLAQAELKEGFNQDADKIALDDPVTLKALLRLGTEYKNKYLDKNICLKLPLYASFQYLAALENEIGLRYTDRAKEMEPLLERRNHSILAHGIQPLDKADYEKMWLLIIDFSRIKESELPVFPQIHAGPAQ